MRILTRTIQLLMLLSATTTLGAQQNPARSYGLLVPAGVVGGVLGFAAGAAVGLGTDPNGWTFVPLGLAGETFGVPLAVHLANGRRGARFGREYGMSALVGVGGLLVAARAANGLHNARGSALVAVSAQALMAGIIERGSSGSAQSEPRDQRVMIAPTNHGLGVLLRLTR